MPVPSYNVITDAEIGIGKPMTSSLAFRLRDNVCALLGIDPATVSPAPTLPLSYFKKDTYVDLSESVDGANGSPGPSTSTFVVGDSSLSGFDFRIGFPFKGNVYTAHIFLGDTSGSPGCSYIFNHIGVEWGATDYVRICAQQQNLSGGYTMPASLDVTIQVGGGWVDVATARSGNDHWQAQAVLSGTHVTLAFRPYRADNPANHMKVVLELRAVAQHFHSAF